MILDAAARKRPPRVMRRDWNDVRLVDGRGDGERRLRGVVAGCVADVASYCESEIVASCCVAAVGGVVVVVVADACCDCCHCAIRNPFVSIDTKALSFSLPAFAESRTHITRSMLLFFTAYAISTAWSLAATMFSMVTWFCTARVWSFKAARLLKETSDTWRAMVTCICR